MDLRVTKLRNEFDGLHYLISTSDDKTLFLRIWKPQKTPKKEAILVFHGITAYSGPYEILAEPLTQKGYAVYGLDLRGHGLSDGIRGDYPSKERLVKDLCETITYIKQKAKHVILLGHSLGVLSSLIATNHCLEDINGLILLSAARTFRPGVYPKISILTKLRILISSMFFPSKPVITYYREGMLGIDDPLFNFKYTFRFMKIFRAEDLKLPERLHFPIFVGIGEDDELFTIEAGRELFNEIPSDEKEFFIIPGAKHAYFPERSLDRLIKWLDEKFE
ncbi:MAG: alpha/beta hydrolase [Promethearchaeota archaeon]